MARQLKPDEKRSFAFALKNPEVLVTSEETCQEIDTKRDEALRLTPELEAWFGKQFPPWSNS